MKNWDPENISIITLLIGCIGLMALGVDSAIKDIFMGLAGYIIASQRVKRGQNKRSTH